MNDLVVTWIYREYVVLFSDRDEKALSAERGRRSNRVLPGCPFEGGKKKCFRERPDSTGTASGVPGQTDHCIFLDRADPAGNTEREEIHCHGIFPDGICNRNDYVSDVYRKHCLSGRYGVRLSGPGRDCDSGDHNRKSILYTGNLQRYLRCLYNLKEN